LKAVRGILIGVGPGKTFKVLLKNASGAYHESAFVAARAIEAKLDEALDWLDREVILQVEKGEAEEIALAT